MRRSLTQRSGRGRSAITIHHLTIVAPEKRSMNHARAALAAVALAVAGIATVTLDVVAPGAGPLIQPLSSFAHTDYAWLWRLSVGAASAGVLLLALAVRPLAVSRSFRARLTAAGVGLAAAGVFPADLWFPWERPPTPSGAVHVAGVLLVVAAFAVAMLRRAGGAPGTAVPAPGRACATAYLTVLIGSVVYVAAMVTTGRPPLLFGLCERLLFGSALAWCGVLAGAVVSAG
jgi:hypothetical protein